MLALHHELPVPAIGCAAVGEDCSHDSPAPSDEPEIRPAEDPEEGQVEEPPEPGLVAAVVLPAWTVYGDAVVRDGEADIQVTTIVGGAYQRCEEGL